MDHVINNSNYPVPFFPKTDALFIRRPRRIDGAGGAEARIADMFYQNSPSDKKQAIFIDTPTLSLNGVYKAAEQGKGNQRYSIRINKDDSEWLSMVLVNLGTLAFDNMVNVLKANKDLCPRSCRAIIDDANPSSDVHMKPIFNPEYESHFLKVQANCPVWNYDNMEAGGIPLSNLPILPSHGQYRLRLRAFGIFLGPHRQGATYSSSLSIMVEQILFRSTTSDNYLTLGLNMQEFEADIASFKSPEIVPTTMMKTKALPKRDVTMDLFLSDDDDDGKVHPKKRSTNGKARHV